MGLFGAGILGTSAEDVTEKYSNKRPSLVEKTENVNIN